MLKRESNQNWMKARVCHSLPGRLRLTATGLRFLPDNGRALAEALARFGGMRRVRVNTVVESVLLEYDPERLDAQTAQDALKYNNQLRQQANQDAQSSYEYGQDQLNEQNRYSNEAWLDQKKKKK